jgi:hypothetical protein
MKQVGFFQENPGINSLTRVAFLGGIVWACVFVTICVFTFKWTAGEIVAVFSGVSAPFFALKLIQKPMESKVDNNKEE